MKPIVICALYQFIRLEDFASYQAPLRQFMHEQDLRGTLLLAREGINGTVAGANGAVRALLDYLNDVVGISDLDIRFSYHDANPFYRAKVRLKKEIVTLGVADIDPLQDAGTYVEPEAWNALIRDPATIVIDTRNDYEVGIGTFRNAVNPETTSFRDFPDYVRKHLDPATPRRIAMFCTGGIRCEKSTAYLKQLGFDEVYHLRGGILNYLERIPPEESLWQGECFVFDNRVSVGHRLVKGRHDQCHACRMPITEQDKESPAYEEGVSCPHCHNRWPEERRRRFQERERQIRIARDRGEEHLGDDAGTVARQRRQIKRRKREAASDQHRP